MGRKRRLVEAYLFPAEFLTNAWNSAPEARVKARIDLCTCIPASFRSACWP